MHRHGAAGPFGDAAHEPQAASSPAAKYSFVRCFVEGFGTGRGDDVLEGFQRWLSEQPQHCAVRNYAWWSLVLREVFDHGNEDDLAYPGDDALVIDHLFARLRAFMSLVETGEGTDTV